MTSNRVVVVGGSVAGLLSAVALAETFTDVVVLDRDELIDGPIDHNGVPQGKQIHVILPAGLAMIEELIPDFAGQLRDEGCPTWDQVRDVATVTSAGWRIRTDSPVATVGFRRPLLEWVIRRHVKSLPQCHIRTGVVCGLETTADGRDVGGVRLVSGEVIPADLVVDASGRGSQSPKWLTQIGYPAPTDTEVLVYMGYASQLIRIPEGVLPPSTVGIEAMPYPGHLRGAALLPVDDGLHMLTAIGMMKDYPPRDYPEFIRFLDDAPTTWVGAIARHSEPVGELNVYRSPGDRRRMWESLDRRPGAFLVVGDAVASFNPIYGQGMTQAANAALTLRNLLRDERDLQLLPRRFHNALSGWTDVAFDMAASGDSAFDGAELKGWTPPATDATYDEDLAAFATVDADAAVALAKAELLMDFTDVHSAHLKAKVQQWRAADRPLSGTDRDQVPAPLTSPSLAETSS